MKALAVRLHGLREMLRLLRRRPASFALALLLATSALTLLLAGALLGRTMMAVAGKLPLAPEINVFLAAGTAPADLRQLQSRLTARPDVQSVEAVTRDEALRSIAPRLGSALEELKSNPLPDVLVVTLRSGIDPADLEAAISELRGLPRVGSAVADVQWHRQLSALRDLGTGWGIAIGVIASALLVSILIAAVGLLLSGCAPVLRVMSTVGADTRFIARPYVYASFFTLACAAGLAVILCSASARHRALDWTPVARGYGAMVEVGPSVEWIAGLVVGAGLFGAVAAAVGMRRALRRSAAVISPWTT